jgi:hypothetical protein
VKDLIEARCLDANNPPGQPMTGHPTQLWRNADSEVSTGWGGQALRIIAELVCFKRRRHKNWLRAPHKPPKETPRCNLSKRIRSGFRIHRERSALSQIE